MGYLTIGQLGTKAKGREHFIAETHDMQRSNTHSQFDQMADMRVKHEWIYDYSNTKTLSNKAKESKQGLTYHNPEWYCQQLEEQYCTTLAGMG